MGLLTNDSGRPHWHCVRCFSGLAVAQTPRIGVTRPPLGSASAYVNPNFALSGTSSANATSGPVPLGTVLSHGAPHLAGECESRIEVASGPVVERRHVGHLHVDADLGAHGTVDLLDMPACARSASGVTTSSRWFSALACYLVDLHVSNLCDTCSVNRQLSGRGASLRIEMPFFPGQAGVTRFEVAGAAGALHSTPSIRSLWP